MTAYYTYMSQQLARAVALGTLCLALAGCITSADSLLTLLPQEESAPSVELASTGSPASTAIGNSTSAGTKEIASQKKGTHQVASAEPVDSDLTTASLYAPSGKPSSGIARLFSFGKIKQPAKIVDLADDAPPNKAGQGAVTKRPSTTPVEALPGVRQLDTLYALDTTGEFHESDDELMQLASAGGLARLTPRGLRRQHDKVQTACFKPELVRLLSKVRSHYGKEVIVTSGYRSIKHNRNVGGARSSRHTTCQAADIQVPGVSKWQLAKYVRTISGRGGVGTYCHTRSVHVDVGTKRDWNWRCKRG